MSSFEQHRPITPINKSSPIGNGRLSSLSSAKVEVEKEREVLDIKSIGRSGIKGSTKEPKKQQLIIPCPSDDFAKTYDGDPKEKSIDPESSNSNPVITTEKGTQETSKTSETRADPFAGSYGLITNAPSKKSSSERKAPLLSRSRPKGWKEIENEDEKLKFELANRPDDVQQEAYDRVPIAEFGMAMIFGMGYDPDKDSRATKVKEAARRPERLGLGASIAFKPHDPTATKSNKDSKKNLSSTQSLKHETPYDEGKRVKVVSGEHKGVFGRILKNLDGKYLMLTLYNDVDIKVGIWEVEKSGNEGPTTDNMTFSSSKAGDSRSSSSHLHSNSASTSSSSSKKRISNDLVDFPLQAPSKYPKLDEHSLPHSSSHFKPSSTVSHHEKPAIWVNPFIRVKVISKTFGGGKYYCKKGVIEDVISGSRCVVKLDDSTVIDDIDESCLETVIPSVGGRVMVVRGSEVGARGVVRDKDLNRELVFVQIEDELDVVKFGMDEVAEYHG